MVGRQLGVRLAFLFVAPVVAFLLTDRGVLIFAVLSSFAAAGLDALRQRKKCLPFPIYILLIYALQTAYYLVMSQAAHFSPSRELQAVQQAPRADAVCSSYKTKITCPTSLLCQWDGTTCSEDLGAFLGGQAEKTAAVAVLPPGSQIQTMSVVIAGHNEHKYMKRTLASIYERTPASILKEIIVVDDGSTPPLAANCVDFPDVKIIRHEKRLGLIKSKFEGGNFATSDMIMFLDAHVKPEWNWIDPILRHLNINYKRVVVPLIPILDGETWEPNNNAVGTKMMFDWSLMFNWFEDFNDLVPCMSGGLFAITRQWWHESGEYDSQMMMWGAENIEQSIRIWLCGGEIYVARDSRVAHVFRSKFPYVVNSTEIYINKVRTVETWFDDYKTYYYEADPVARQFAKVMGSIDERLALKQKLQCKPFKWYVEKFRDVFTERHMLPEEVFLIQDTTTGLCLAAAQDEMHVVEAACNEKDNEQKWTTANTGEGLRNAGVKKCIDANAGVSEKDGSLLFMYACYGKNNQQRWAIVNGNVKWTDQSYCVKAPTDANAPSENLAITKCGEFLSRSGPFQKYKAKVAPL